MQKQNDQIIDKMSRLSLLTQQESMCTQIHEINTLMKDLSITFQNAHKNTKQRGKQFRQQINSSLKLFIEISDPKMKVYILENAIELLQFCSRQQSLAKYMTITDCSGLDYHYSLVKTLQIFLNYCMLHSLSGCTVKICHLVMFYMQQISNSDNGSSLLQFSCLLMKYFNLCPEFDLLLSTFMSIVVCNKAIKHYLITEYEGSVISMLCSNLSIFSLKCQYIYYIIPVVQQQKQMNCHNFLGKLFDQILNRLAQVQNKAQINLEQQKQIYFNLLPIVQYSISLCPSFVNYEWIRNMIRFRLKTIEELDHLGQVNEVMSQQFQY